MYQTAKVCQFHVVNCQRHKSRHYLLSQRVVVGPGGRQALPTSMFWFWLSLRSSQSSPSLSSITEGVAVKIVDRRCLWPQKCGKAPFFFYPSRAACDGYRSWPKLSTRALASNSSATFLFRSTAINLLLARQSVGPATQYSLTYCPNLRSFWSVELKWPWCEASLRRLDLSLRLRDLSLRLREADPAVGKGFPTHTIALTRIHYDL